LIYVCYTSSLVAFYVPENQTEIVNQLFLDADEVMISSLTKVEFISALKKKLRMKTMTQKEINAAVNEFEELIRQQLFKFHTIGQKNFDIASTILKQTKLPLRTLDAIQLSVCFESKLSLLSFDKVLTKAAKEFEIQNINYSG
jgi:predicted nucleic acid-binding protein